jgi:hypothetical protein
MTTKKQIKDDNFAGIFQIAVKVRHFHPEMPLMEILHMAIGLNECATMTDEQLLESLELFYAGENRK